MMERLLGWKGHGLWAPLALALFLLWSRGAWAERDPDAGLADEEVEEGPAPLPWCGARPPMEVVAGFDDGKFFQAVVPMSREAFDEMLATLCPGDRVRVVTFGTTLQWLGAAVEITDEESLAVLSRRLRTRPALAAQHSINDLLVKGAFSHWDALDLAEDTILALYVFTDTIESDAPPRYEGDFDWTSLPSYMQNSLLVVVSLLERAAPSGRPSIFTVSAPPGWKVSAFPSGGLTRYRTWRRCLRRRRQRPRCKRRVVRCRWWWCRRRREVQIRGCGCGW